MTTIITRVIDCWVFRETGNELEFLIMKRSKNRIYEGIYHCVHGKIEKNETAWQAALRELKEETGFDAKKLWTVDMTSSFYEAATDQMNLVPVFAALVEETEPKLGTEHESFEWLNLTAARKKLAWRNHKKAVEIIDMMMQTTFPQKKWLEVNIDRI